MDHLILVRKPDLVLIKKKKRTYYQVDFVIPAHHWIKIKNKKNDKYLDLARGLTKPWNLKMISNTNCSWCLCIGLQRPGKETGEQEIRRKIKIILTTALLKSIRILWNLRKLAIQVSWRAKVTWCHSDLSEKPQVRTDAKKLTRSKMINIATTTIPLYKTFSIKWWNNLQTPQC